MHPVYLNRITTAVPPYEMHQKFQDFVAQIVEDNRTLSLFKRMAARSQIAERYSVFSPHRDPKQLDTHGFYRKNQFPSTRLRMQAYEQQAFPLAQQALDALMAANGDLKAVTHLIITSCTGFYAPGLDWQVINYYHLNPAVERTLIGFMGCYAAINGLKTAYHIVRSQPDANVLVLNLELCTLHLQETQNLETLLSFLLFADGCAASLVSAQPSGLRLDRFKSGLLTGTDDQITWAIGDNGFDMVLSGKVPSSIVQQLPAFIETFGDEAHQDNQAHVSGFKHWAVHPGGRSVLDAVETCLSLPPEALRHSRRILRDFGNMSSATLMFVLKAIMEEGHGGPGIAMGFGPGISVESMRFVATGAI